MLVLDVSVRVESTRGGRREGWKWVVATAGGPFAVRSRRRFPVSATVLGAV